MFTKYNRETIIIRLKIELENFIKLLKLQDFGLTAFLPALPTIRPGCTRFVSPEFLRNKGNHVGHSNVC